MSEEVLSVSQSLIGSLLLPASYAQSTDRRRVTGIGSDLQAAQTFNVGTTPKPTKFVDDTITIPGGGTLEYDLTAARVVGAVDGSGDPTAFESLDTLACFAYAFSCPATNTAAIKIEPKGDATGYPIFGPGGAYNVNQGEKMQAVLATAFRVAVAAAGARVVNFVGTAGETCRIVLAFN